jgi:hypothetical protein
MTYRGTTATRALVVAAAVVWARAGGGPGLVWLAVVTFVAAVYAASRAVHDEVGYEARWRDVGDEADPRLVAERAAVGATRVAYARRRHDARRTMPVARHVVGGTEAWPRTHRSHRS